MTMSNLKTELGTPDMTLTTSSLITHEDVRKAEIAIDMGHM